MPASRAAHDVKYAHHGPTPLPAVAWRYCAIRGASLEPGGCSATPTSRWTAASTAAPPPVAGAGPVGSGNAPVTPNGRLEALIAAPPRLPIGSADPPAAGAAAAWSNCAKAAAFPLG